MAYYVMKKGNPGTARLRFGADCPEGDSIYGTGDGGGTSLFHHPLVPRPPHAGGGGAGISGALCRLSGGLRPLLRRGDRHGPGRGKADSRPSFRRSRGSTRGLRGRKRSLYNGGIAVPALVRWPGVVALGGRYDFPASTLDYLPALIDALDYTMPDNRPLDGESLLPLMRGEARERRNPIPYRFRERKDAMFGSGTFAVMGNRFKLVTNLEGGPERELYDVIADPYERDNVMADFPDEADRLEAFLREKMESFEKSHFGEDYQGSLGKGESWTPVVGFQGPGEGWTAGEGGD